MSCDNKLQEKYYKKYMKYKQKYIEITTKKSVSDEDHSKIKSLVKSSEWNTILKSIENINNLKNDINENMYNMGQHDNKMNILMQNAFKLSELFDFIKQKYQFSDLEMFTLTDLYKKNLNPEPLFDKTPEFQINNLFSITEDIDEIPEHQFKTCGKAISLEYPNENIESITNNEQLIQDDLKINEHQHGIKDIDGLIDLLSKDTEKEIEIVTDKKKSKQIVPDQEVPEPKASKTIVPDPESSKTIETKVPKPDVSRTIVPKVPDKTIEPKVPDKTIEPKVPDPESSKTIVPKVSDRKVSSQFGNQLISK